MTNLRIGDEAPDFEAQTTEGVIKFHEWLGDSWGGYVLTSKGFYPGLYNRTWLYGKNQS